MRYSKAVLSLAIHLVSPSRYTGAFTILSNNYRSKLTTTSTATTRFSSTSSDPSVAVPELKPDTEIADSETETYKSPWAPENLDPVSKKGINKSRFRQHVNPLARRFQMQTELDPKWPSNGAFSNLKLPLHIDIGCGKGGFLLELAKQRLEGSEAGKSKECEEEARNYLGLEIRPSVAQFAKERVDRRKLTGRVDFIGCNANVDLDRILNKYVAYGGEVGLVSIQFPDPHFKKSHQKRRVVTKELVLTLAKHVKEGREVFIQSDIQDVLDNMRETIREFGCDYFVDTIENLDEYMEDNPIGVPTEREVSVIDQDLPIYRTVFRR
eukprot:CAMPEP_0204646156 /NCGR_PEP_ID=MMETSP0718-20130828/4110_1 /ASSEMBLY_ACC=CAM_ASM_000674 /TAXON_ID=230516 /ORGANISM="Chaetoceros curvisetus" /LENGTH=323 /DNA_ID=CAMNT_0051668319 /DNA_START=55 /DNA_END=1022 /DNA_ORIENTATION=+